MQKTSSTDLDSYLLTREDFFQPNNPEKVRMMSCTEIRKILTAKNIRKIIPGIDQEVLKDSIKGLDRDIDFKPTKNNYMGGIVLYSQGAIKYIDMINVRIQDAWDTAMS